MLALTPWHPTAQLPTAAAAADGRDFLCRSKKQARRTEKFGENKQTLACWWHGAAWRTLVTAAMGKKKSKKSSKRAPEDDGDDGDDLAEQPPTVTESAAGAGSGSGAGGGAAAVDGAEAVAGSSATAAAEPEPRSEAPLAATEKREAAAATEAAAAHSQHNAPPVAAAQAAVSPSGVPAPEEVEMVMSTSAEAIDDMAAGLLGTFQPAVEAMLKQLREIKSVLGDRSHCVRSVRTSG